MKTLLKSFGSTWLIPDFVIIYFYVIKSRPDKFL